MWADKLDQASLWKALKSRRTIASTGARIKIESRLGDAIMGSVAQRKEGSRLRFEIEGTAPIQSVDLIEGDATGCRVRRLAGNVIDTRFTPGRHFVKVECGWGKGDAVTEWLIENRVIGGRLLSVQPCFRHSRNVENEETSSERILSQDGKRVTWTGRTVHNPSGLMGGTHFNASGTQAMILEIEGNSKTRVQTKSGGICLDIPLTELAQRSVGTPVDGYMSPAIKIHRAVPEREFVYHYEEDYTPYFSNEETGYVYIRVIQSDGHTAWASPIWWE